MPTLLSLPPEVLLTIAEEVKQEGLANIHQVCKELSNIANERFAVTYFSERNHVVSPYSIGALVDITAHPFFGRFVEAVIINGIRMSTFEPVFGTMERAFFRSGSKTDDLDNSFAHSSQYNHNMDQIFGNIKQHRNKVTIGLCDRNLIPNSKSSFGWNELVNTTKNAYTYHLSEALTHTIAAAEKAGLTVRGLSLKIHSHTSDNSHAKLNLLGHAVCAFLKQNTTSTPDFSIVCAGYGRNRVTYAPESGRLELDDLSFARPNFRSTLLGNVLNELASATISELFMKACHAWDESPFPHDFLTNNSGSLRSVHLQNITLFNSGWSTILSILSGVHGLKRCHLEELRECSRFDHLILILCSPRKRRVLTARGEHVAAKLKDLAIQAATHRAAILQRPTERRGDEDDVYDIR